MLERMYFKRNTKARPKTYEIDTTSMNFNHEVLGHRLSTFLQHKHFYLPQPYHPTTILLSYRRTIISILVSYFKVSS